MKSKYVIIAVLFSLLAILQSFYMVAFTLREGASTLTLIALLFAITPVLFIWLFAYICYRKKWRFYIFISFCFVVLVSMEYLLPVSPLKTNLYAYFKGKSLDRTEVMGVHDELFFSTRGNPIGIRVSFTVIFPSNGEYNVSPTIRAENNRYHLYQMSMNHFANFTTEPEPIQVEAGVYKYQKGVAYKITGDLLPSFIHIYPYDRKEHKKGELCMFFQESKLLSEADFLEIVKDHEIDSAYRIWVNVGGNSYFVTKRTAVEKLSEKRYSLADFYKSLAAEGAQQCQF